MLSFWSYYAYVYNNIVIAMNIIFEINMFKPKGPLRSKSWPMKAWLQDGDQWKAENLAGFCNWPITRCFIQNDRARLIIEHSTNFALSGNIDGLCSDKPS